MIPAVACPCQGIFARRDRRRPTAIEFIVSCETDGAAGAGAAVGPGGGVIVLTNQNGARLALSGRQAGLIVAADLNGLVISLR